MIGAFAWGLAAGAAFVIGALIGLRTDVGERPLGLVAAFGAGALISAVAYELIDEAGRLSGGGGHVAGDYSPAARSTSSPRRRCRQA